MLMNAEMERPAAPHGDAGDRRITVSVLGLEGTTANVVVNVNAPCRELLVKGLDGLYGEGAKDAAKYDVVVNGAVVADTAQKIGDAGIAEGVLVQIQPKEISRGGIAAA